MMSGPKILKSKYFILSAAILLIVAFALLATNASFAAYNHAGDTDSVNFRTVYPDQVGTKLDSCTLCHTGGSYVSGGKTTTLGSCQWCHYKYGYNPPHGDIMETLNQYGKDYLSSGRNTASLGVISSLDSDVDTYSNAAEIAAIRYPGDPDDTPAKVPAPSRVFTRQELEQMPQHTQFLLMNASKSTDDYVQYTGVTLEGLLQGIMLDSATGVTVLSPDGFSQYHSLSPSTNPSSYHVSGTYPAASFYYSEEADIAKNPAGWANYSAPSCAGRANGDPIVNPDGLKMLLAIKRDGQYLAPGVLNAQNKLDGEGPFRVVPPQKNPGPPDQRSTAANQAVVWPYDPNADHNAGSSSRTVTIIRVEPLPEGTTDIDVLEAGWQYVDENKIVVYGAINPVSTILGKLDSLGDTIRAANNSAFKSRGLKAALAAEIGVAERLVAKGAEMEGRLQNPSRHPKIDEIKAKLAKAAYTQALKILNENVLPRIDGCVVNGAVDSNDWVTNCDIQKQLYWAVHEIAILLDIIT